MKLTKLMEGYFDGRSILKEDRPKPISPLPQELPIKAKESKSWKISKDPSRLVKLFQFKSENNFNNFVMDVLEMQTEMNHHGRISIQFPKIKIEIWTRSLMDITELDQDWTKKVDDIFEGYKDD